MTQQKKRTGIYWIAFIASMAALLYAIGVHFEYLTLIIPFVCLSFVKALDII